MLTIQLLGNFIECYMLFALFIYHKTPHNQRSTAQKIESAVCVLPPINTKYPNLSVEVSECSAGTASALEYITRNEETLKHP